MSLAQKLQHEIEAVALTTLYFAVWLAALTFIKHLRAVHEAMLARGTDADLARAAAMQARCICSVTPSASSISAISSSDLMLLWQATVSIRC